MLQANLPAFKNLSAAEAIVDILDREGVEVIFGIPGGPLLSLYDKLANHPRIRIVLVKHEQAAAYEAFAYARVSGRLGVCMATLGPGATNLLAGIPVAFVASVPILALTGQVQTSAIAHGGHQESTGWFRTPNQEFMYSATCKHTATCTEADRLPDMLRHSIRIATGGRPGPAHLIIPANLLQQRIRYRPLAPEQYRIRQSLICDDFALDQIADLIDESRFPLILAGERALLPDAGPQIEFLAEQFGIPIMTDLSCKSIVDERSPMFMGCIGVLGHRAGEKYLKEHSDLLLSVGQTFDEISTLSWDPAFAENRSLVQLDTDPEEIGKVYPVSLASVGHLPVMLENLAIKLRSRNVVPDSERSGLVSSLVKKFPLFSSSEMQSDKVPMLPQRILAELQECLPEDALILLDSSKWSRWMGRYFQARRGAIVAAHDYEPMGWAVAGAIGAKLAQPNRPVYCVCGDGAFLMSAMEVSTAANLNLDITWLIMNDSRLGIIYDLQKGLYSGRISGTTFQNPDFSLLAASFGIRGAVVERPGELALALQQAGSLGGSLLVDIRFDPDEIPPVRPRSLLITRGMGLPDPKPSPETTRALIKLLKEK